MEGDDRRSLKLAQLPALRDIYRVSATLADEELYITTRRYEQSLDRRDKLRERTRFGLLALNATSLVAVLSSSGGEWLTRLKIADADIAQSILLLILGLVAGALAIWWSGITATRDAVDDFEHLLEVRQRKADYDGAATVEAEQDLLNRPTPKWKIPPDYRWSRIDNILTNFAGSAWIVAVGGIAWEVAKRVDWCSTWCG
ncbi:hypothetical protein [Sphingobium sp. B11D3D]|uniref:hypothetical protein n=1 Tax=Sphingobium sp. B11D3D TaxID=2940576 RepID=UPI0022254231|nr:hypothetical protein [Sphingobium sp. B11D3D]MCW2368509.1 hypothetical protein [Sphingobium sp. B11D3D]